MGYQIFTGHRLETLIEAHRERFRSTFLGPRPLLVVQSQSLSQWLKLTLARSLGGYASLETLFQDELMRRLLDGHSEGPLLFLDNLKLALYERLAEVLREPVAPVFRPLVGRHGPPDPQRLFELADHISGVFHHYAMNSKLLPAALRAGVAPAEVEDTAAFAWQSALWNDLLEAGKGSLAGLALERLTKSPPLPSGPPPSILLVGSAFLSRRAAAFLRSWAEAGLVDVVQLLLLPAPVLTLTQGPAQRPWTSWGSFGRAFLETLPPSIEAPSPPSASALGRLQTALAQGLAFPATDPDGTLEVVSSPHPLRELEALRDRLLSALAADPTLEVNDIAVLAPDINVYAPFLDAVFASDDPGRNLRYHLIDLNLGRENAWLRALDALLALLSGSFDRPTLFALIDTPAFAERWSLSAEDRELWLAYTEEVSAWREESSEEALQSWSGSWDRLFTGWFRLDAAEAPGVPPVEASPSSFQTLGRFHQLVQELRSRGQEARRPRPFLEWVRFLDQAVATFLGEDAATGPELSGRLRTLALDSPSETLFPWSGFRAFAQDQIAHFPGRRGQLLTEGIHCSSLRPLRAIPFRVIAVLGLDEGQFPRSVPTPSFDLRRFEPGQDALSSLALDRYTFWETVMAARSLLYLSFQGRSPVDGSERPPSPVLADLLDLLEEGGSRWPIQQVAVKDFAADTETVWSPRTQRRIEAVLQSTSRAEVTVLSPPVEPGELALAFPEVRTSEIVQAFVAPARFHLERVRLVRLREEDRRGVDDEEPWSLTFLDRQGWLQECLRRRLSGDNTVWDVEGYLASLRATGRVRPGVFSDRDRRELTRQAEQASAWADELRAEGWATDGAPRSRGLWSGHPWAQEPTDRFARGQAVLLPRLLYSQEAPFRTKVEAAVKLLLEPASSAQLATLNPQGRRQLWTWSLDDDATRALAGRAEAYWEQSAHEVLPFYPDLIEAIARRRAEQDEPWGRSVEEAWWSVKGAERVQSPSTLTRCPYAALAFPGDPDGDGLAQTLQPWWTSLFVPLWEAWQ